MLTRTRLILLLPWLVGVALAQDSGSDTAKVKEQELADVRERISALKQSMDEAAEERDRVTAELQELDVAIAERRARLKEIEREHRYTADKKAKLDAELTERESHLDEERILLRNDHQPQAASNSAEVAAGFPR